MQPRDDDIKSADDVLLEVADEALNYTPKNDPDEPRDATWLRWLKFASLIIVPAIVFGVVFAFGSYLLQFSAQDSYHQQRAEREVQNDSVPTMKIRFIIGGGIGGMLGVIYVVRCIMRKVDP